MQLETTNSPLWNQLVGFNEGLRETIALAKRVANSSEPVLLSGETGTGKSMLARVIHAESPRRNGPFVEIPCSSLNDNLIESELFGHVRGAFTGALQSYSGKLAEADGGTVFLDEIGELSSNAQTRLLHFLQEGFFYRVGGNAPQRVDVRVIAATHRKLRDLCHRSHFREDLYFRLAVLQVRMPSLRERGSDVLEMAEAILARTATVHHRSLQFSPEAKEQITSHSWPGNVRELQNAIKRAVVCLDPGLTTIESLNLESDHADETLVPSIGYISSSKRGLQLSDSEIETIRKALVICRGSIQDTAKFLGITRYALYRRLKKLGFSAQTAITLAAQNLEALTNANA